MKSKIKPLRVAFYAAVVVAVVFALIEIVFRVVESGEIKIDTEQKYWALWQHTNLYGQHNFGDAIDVDDKPVPVHKNPGERRVFCLGSSSTFGAGLQDRRQAFPQQLDRMIPEARVYNAGWGGYNSYQLWIYLSEVLVLLQPDVVVFYYGGNECYGHSAKSFYPRALKIVAKMKNKGVTEIMDLHDAVAFGTSNRIALEAWFLLSESRSFLYLRDRIIRWQYDREFKTTRYRTTDECVALKEPTTEKILEDMVDLSRQKGFEIIFVSEIGSAGLHANPAVFKLMNALCETGPARCVNALDALNSYEYPGLFIDTSHLTPKGNLKLAGLLEPEIRDALGLSAKEAPLETPANAGAAK